LQKETDINPQTPFGTPKTSIACNGSVILKYPGFKSRCENYIARMIMEASTSGVFRAEKVVLEPTYEAAIFGAAVAVAMAEDT
jgi:hexokinase